MLQVAKFFCEERSVLSIVSKWLMFYSSRHRYRQYGAFQAYASPSATEAALSPVEPQADKTQAAGKSQFALVLSTFAYRSRYWPY